jgi:hypothetical protein
MISTNEVSKSVELLPGAFALIKTTLTPTSSVLLTSIATCILILFPIYNFY